jgi:hypothetical protein
MKRLSLIFTLLAVLLSAAFFARATCVGGDTGTAGNDTIECTVANPPTGDVTGQGGDDVITIESGVVTTVDISGGNLGVVTETGNDTIVNNGQVDGLIGDSLGNGGSGNDTITNNGMAGTIYGDGVGVGGSGNDAITNNGTAVGDIIGDNVSQAGSGSDVIVNNGDVGASIWADTRDGTGSGNDTVINNGTIDGNLYGDSVFGTGTGDDTITNNGTIGIIWGDTNLGANASGDDVITNNGTSNSIHGDNGAGTGTGNDTITNNGAVNGDIIAGGGNDTVTIQGNDSSVGGIIDGGAGTDTLTFDLRSADPEQLDAWAAEIAAANPNGGTIILNGHTYTWTNFEDLQALLHLIPINVEGSTRPFCAAVGGLDIYIAVGDEGTFSLYASAESISAALSYARVYEMDVPIETSETSQLWALITGEVQIRTPQNEIVSTFFYENYCGELPEGDPALYVPTTPPAVVEEYPDYTIINQPYGG